MSKKVKYISLCNDLMSKYILGSQERIEYVIDFLTSLLGLDSLEFKGVKVLNSVKLTKERIKEKGFESDILVKTKDKIIYNLEIQNVDNKNSRVKNTMYVMRVFGGKLKNGENYDKTKPVFQIVVMNDKDYKNRNNELARELVVCSKDRCGNYIDEYFKIFIVDINCEVDYTKVDKRLLGWLLLFRANTFKEANDCIKYNEMLRGVIEDMKKYASEDYVQDYTIRDKLYRSDINSAKREGRNEGIELGRNEGMELGRNKTLLENAYKMFEKGIDINDIEEITGINIKEELGNKYENAYMLKQSKPNISKVRETKAKYNDPESMPKEINKFNSKGVSYKAKLKIKK